jgi:hypothetical protein
MSKRAYLKFDLPEDAESFKIACNAEDYKYAWDDLYNELRKKRKYEDKDSLTIEEIYDLIKEIELHHEINRT